MRIPGCQRLREQIAPQADPMNCMVELIHRQGSIFVERQARLDPCFRKWPFKNLGNLANRLNQFVSRWSLRIPGLKIDRLAGRLPTAHAELLV